MKRILFLILLLTSTITGSSLDLNELFNFSRFNYEFNAYNGTEYYPFRTNKEFQYYEKLDLKFGWELNFKENYEIWIDLSYYNELFDKKITLESTGFSYTSVNWQIFYMLSQLEYSNRSRLLNCNVRDVYFNQPVFIDYLFQGFRIRRMLDKYKFSISIGGNSYNRGIVHYAINYFIQNTELELFCIYSSRNEFLNEKAYTYGFELLHESKFLYIYLSEIYHSLMESSTEKLESLNEVILYPGENIFLGTSFVYSIFNWEAQRDWRSRSSFGLDLQNISIILSYEYQNTEGTLDNWGNRKINLLTNYNFSPFTSIGLDATCFNPIYDEEYYQFGIQGRIKYETD